MTEPSSKLYGVPDSFRRLWAPHRMVYIGGDKPKDETGCLFCLSPTRHNEDGLIVTRGEHAFVIMNPFPYSPEHLLVCPYRHVSGYVDAIVGETREMVELTRWTIAVLTEVSRPAGFNVGINQRTVAGAGVATHLHQHVVPCWLGGTNFMPITGRTRALPQLLGDACERLAETRTDIA